MATAKPRTREKPRLERIEARLSADAKAIIQHAADLSGRSLSDFVVSSALKAAEAEIRERELIMVTMRDYIALTEALQNPQGPNEALREAMRRHRELLGP